MKEKLLICAAILFGLSLIFTVISYIMFHYLGADNKLHKEFHKQSQKPFVTTMAGVGATFFFVWSVVLLLLGLIAF
jgi:fumarate reductase subunit D